MKLVILYRGLHNGQLSHPIAINPDHVRAVTPLDPAPSCQIWLADDDTTDPWDIAESFDAVCFRLAGEVVK